jgi:peptidoglycan/xylan/chitin deacetylase (PgdA/CDA1 family)
MQERLQHIASSSARLLPLSLLTRLSGVRTVLPFYHTVSDNELIHVKHLYPVISSKAFEQDLDYLLRHYKPASYELLLHEKKPKGNHFILTFDDGLRQFYDLVAPILLRKGIPAVCFVNTAFIDNKRLFYRMKVSILIEHLLNHPNNKLHPEVHNILTAKGLSYKHPFDLKKITDPHQSVLDEIATLADISFDDYLKDHRPYLTTSQLRELKDQGFAIGAHSVSHPYFPLLTEEEQIRETLESVRFVKTELSMNDGLFSFPYTDIEISESFFEAIRSEVKLTFGTANLKCDCIATNYQRIPMEIFHRKDAAGLLKKQYLQHIIKQLTGKSVIKRK